ncbi:MAG TPA: VOC family protein [Gemmatimonadales bacterium]|jgi:PhnB protein|nr:VOC family protein [Gemmatimonadales bacterium]
MPKSVKPIPSDTGQVTPYLVVRDATSAIDFYKRVFGATEVIRIVDPNGKIGHADLKIGDAHLMLSDEFPEMDANGPEVFGGSPVMIHVYVEDVDEVAARAQKAGARFAKPVENQFYGDRGGKFTDPFGQLWWIASRKENLSPEEMKRRAAEMYEAQPAS